MLHACKAVFVLGENHFRKCFSGNEAVWLVRKILFSGNWNPLTQKKCLWPRKSVYTSIFPSKHFRKMRERERERERESERAWERRSVGRRDRVVDCDLAVARSRRIEIAIDGERGRFEIAIDASRDRAIDRDLAKKARSRSRRRSRSPVVVDDFFLGCGLCFSGFVFSFFFSKHQKIFSGNFFEMQPNTWKHFPFPKISISGKYVFFEKRFTAIKHSLIKYRNTYKLQKYRLVLLIYAMLSFSLSRTPKCMTTTSLKRLKKKKLLYEYLTCGIIQ